MTAMPYALPWRQAGCDERCWRAPAVLAGERETRMIEAHSPEAHEEFTREILRESWPERWHGVVLIGPLRVDFAREQATVLTMPVDDLTHQEWLVLRYLALHRGYIVPATDLIADAWGREYVGLGDPGLRGVIQRLRKKLWEAGPLIQTVHGRGYRLRLELPRPRPVAVGGLHG